MKNQEKEEEVVKVEVAEEINVMVNSMEEENKCNKILVMKKVVEENKKEKVLEEVEGIKNLKLIFIHEKNFVIIHLIDGIINLIKLIKRLTM